jgi:6-phosphogluconolactonase
MQNHEMNHRKCAFGSSPSIEMKVLASLLFTLIASLGLSAEAPFYVGTYTRPGGSQGIYRLTLDLDSGKLSEPQLAAESKNPSFLATHPSGRFIFAANEGDAGPSVSAYAVQPDGLLKPLGQQSSKGPGPCHVWVDATGKNVLVANYGGGSIACIPIKPDGSIGEATAFIQHTGSSVNAQRQKEPHAHSTYTDSSNRLVYACDLGTDKVYIYRFDAARGTLTPNDPPAGDVPPGSGPRHFAFHPKGGYAYVINEITSTITAFKHDARSGALEAIQTISTLPADDTGTGNSTAEVFVHPSGKFLYGSNRGHDSIAAFSIDPANGQLTLIGHTPSGGKVPRNFAIDPSGQWLVTAHQQSDDLYSFKIDQQSGKLTATGSSAKVPAAVCVLFPAKAH